MKNTFIGAVLATTLASMASAGTVTGTVVFEGNPPPMRPITMSADPICDAHHGDETPVSEVLVLGPGQTMGNILVRVVEGLPADRDYPVPEEPVILDQAGCLYSPRVFTIHAGQTLRVLNPDGTLHNVNCRPKVNTPFNRAMPRTLESMEVTFDKPEDPFEFGCDVHPWMRAFCAVVDHPYVDVTGEDGVFKIEGLAPGDYTIEAWHEFLGPQIAEVTVPEDGEVVADFTFTRPAR